MMKGAYPSYGTAVPETGDVHLITLAYGSANAILAVVGIKEAGCLRGGMVP
jgi:hypothetical protein